MRLTGEAACDGGSFARAMCLWPVAKSPFLIIYPLLTIIACFSVKRCNAAGDYAARRTATCMAARYERVEAYTP